MYVANLQRDIVELIDFLDEDQNHASGKKSRGASQLFSKMKDMLEAINVKPEKGRRKDLRRIEDAVRSLHKMAFSDKKDT